MSFATVNGINLYYETSGAGDPLLIVQGMGMDSRFLASLAAPLGERFTTIVFDNRGSGDSDKPSGPYSIEQMADDAAALLDHLHIDRAAVMGVSLGGCIAQMMALRRPGRVGGLILGCTYFSGKPEKIKMAAEPAGVIYRGRGTIEAVARKTLEVSLSRRFIFSRPEEFERLVRWRVEKPVRFRGFDGQRQAFLSFDIEDRIGAIAAPSLILHGSEDALIALERARELGRALAGSRLGIIEGAGHLFFIEQPALTASLVTRFLASRL